eukprot:Colp12_sorted_trinity150504_noHs@12468
MHIANHYQPLLPICNPKPTTNTTITPMSHTTTTTTTTTLPLLARLAVLVSIGVILGLGEVANSHGFERLGLDDNGDALAHQVQVLVERQGDALRHLQCHGDLEVRGVHAHGMLAGEVAHLGHVLADVLKIAVLLRLVHHVLHRLTELLRVLHGVRAGVINHITRGQASIMPHKGRADIHQVLVFLLALDGVHDAAVQHQQARLAVRHDVHHDVAWMQITMHKVVEKHHFQDQSAAQIAEFHLQAVDAIAHFAFQVHKRIDRPALHKRLHHHIVANQRVDRCGKRGPFVVRKLLRELDEVVRLDPQVQLFVHRIRKLSTGLAETQNLQRGELVHQARKQRQKLHIRAHPHVLCVDT